MLEIAVGFFKMKFSHFCVPENISRFFFKLYNRYLTNLKTAIKKTFLVVRDGSGPLFWPRVGFRVWRSSSGRVSG